MLVGTVRRPSAKGIRKLVEYYGDRLVCVRYPHDPAQDRRDKTAESIVEESRWRPSPVPASAPPSSVPVRTAPYEKRPAMRNHRRGRGRGGGGAGGAGAAPRAARGGRRGAGGGAAGAGGGGGGGRAGGGGGE